MAQLAGTGVLPSNSSCWQVRTIHQTDTIHEAACCHESSIDAMDDLSLLSRAELLIDAEIGAIIRPSLVNMLGAMLLDFGLHGVSETSG